jgi:hypothetical protein
MVRVMKTIKTAIGNKKIEDCAESVAMGKIKEILTDHRNELINRLLLDLPGYLGYKFNVKPSKEQLLSVTERLYEIKHSVIDLLRYDAIVQEILSNTNTHLSSETFYKELDSAISWELRPNQLV